MAAWVPSAIVDIELVAYFELVQVVEPQAAVLVLVARDIALLDCLLVAAVQRSWVVRNTDKLVHYR